jgi:signal recognition particle receptor subunit beta
MPHVEKRTGNIIIRIVYDGAPEAGKTTNLVELTKGVSLQRRSRMVSPGTTSRRTEFFDWLTFTGGFVDGRRLKCQLVSVPGQPELLRRRRYLIDSADAVVFVADSRPEHLEANRRAFELMREAVERRGGDVPAGVLLQANKQDLDESLAPEKLAEAMALPSSIPVLSAKALSGDGVMTTFITAVRLGTLRVRALLAGDGLDGVESVESTPAELLAALAKVDDELMARELDCEFGGRPVSEPPMALVASEEPEGEEAGEDLDGEATSEEPDQEDSSSEAADGEDSATDLPSSERPTGEPRRSSLPAGKSIYAGLLAILRRALPLALPPNTRLSDLPPEHPTPLPSEHPTPLPPRRASRAPVSQPPPRRPPLPLQSGVGSGHVWPLVDGRTVFAELAGGTAHFVDEPRPWVSSRMVEAAVEDSGQVRWLMHTADEWSFDQSESHAAKMQLITLVRRLKTLEAWLPPGRALSLHDDGESIRIWMVTSTIPSLREALRDATRNGSDREALRGLVTAVARALAVAANHPEIEVTRSCLDAFGVSGDEPVVLGVPGASEDGTALEMLDRELSSFVEELPGLGLSVEDAEAVYGDIVLGTSAGDALRAWLVRSAADEATDTGG